MESTDKFTKQTKVYLLIPTLETRNTIAETLESITKWVQSFDKLIISVNGLSTIKLELLLGKYDLVNNRKIHVFCTNKNLTALKHFNFIVQKLRHMASEDTLLYILADDDLMPYRSDLNTYLRIISEGKMARIGMGNFQSFTVNQDQTVDEKQNLEPDELINLEEFLVRNKHQYRYTSISSMIVPYGVVADATSFMYRLGSAGRRIEYIWATHKNIKTLYSPPDHSVLVRRHPGQENLTLSYSSYVRDELIYVLWVWLNQPRTRPWACKTNEYGFSITRFRWLAEELVSIKLDHHFPLGNTMLKQIKRASKKLLCLAGFKK